MYLIYVVDVNVINLLVTVIDSRIMYWLKVWDLGDKVLIIRGYDCVNMYLTCTWIQTYKVARDFIFTSGISQYHFMSVKYSIWQSTIPRFQQMRVYGLFLWYISHFWLSKMSLPLEKKLMGPALLIKKIQSYKENMHELT